MQRSVLLVVLALAIASPAIASRVGNFHADRALLQANDTIPSYNLTTSLIMATNLSTTTNSTIFAPLDTEWEEVITAKISYDAILENMKTNATLFEEVWDFLEDIIVPGIHMSSEFMNGTVYTSVGGAKLTLGGTAGNWTINEEDDNTDTVISHVIVSLDHKWQDNIIHTVDLDD